MKAEDRYYRRLLSIQCGWMAVFQRKMSAPGDIDAKREFYKRAAPVQQDFRGYYEAACEALK